MNTRPACSIIMWVYNENPDHLSLAIESILQQSFKDFEFIIVNDCPWNQNLETLIEQYVQQDSRINYIKNTKNQWLAYTLNVWINHAKWSYIVRMDGDDIAFPNRLKVQYQYMLSHPWIDFLWSSATIIDSNGTTLKDLIIKPTQAKNITKYFFQTVVLIHPSIIWKTTTFKKHMYDWSFIRSQDLELWLRCMNQSTFAVLSTPLLYYRTPMLENYKDRISKMRRSTRRWLKAFYKNSRINMHNTGFRFAYTKRLLFYILLRLPTWILVKIMKTKDFIIASK